MFFSVSFTGRTPLSGWDCSRLNFLARLCCDASYLPEGQAWFYVDLACDLAARKIGSRDEFARSYLIGRAMWGGAESDNSGISDIARHLLEDPESSWVFAHQIRSFSLWYLSGIRSVRTGSEEVNALASFLSGSGCYSSSIGYVSSYISDRHRPL
ncbi:MAG: DUF1266 domain-containing protein [Rikenellaceae bacterium]|nr:DUF1266 domain-containing protein [Rikenellaceae bacterium]